MLTIDVITSEGFNNETQKFVTLESFKIDLEHSLSSLSKWETKFEKPFLSQEAKTEEETLEYIKCMTITPDVPPQVFDKVFEDKLPNRNYPSGYVAVVNEYISRKMTATWFGETNGPPGREIITTELIYYWMVAYRIPFECDKWHLNRLLTLIRVCDQKSQPAKKMTAAETLRRNRELNAQRRAQLGTQG